MRALFLCDGAPSPPAIDGDTSLLRKSINWRSPSSDLNLRVENLWDAVLDQVDGRAADLVRIAACVYGADQEISRGGRKDVYGDSWYREFHMAIPVADLEFWSNEEVQERLQATLHFATGDTWRFWFSPYHGSSPPLSLQLGDRLLLGSPDCVVLFSGGADSLCAAVELIVREDARPLLVSHRPSPTLSGRQTRLVKLLAQRAQKRAPAHVGFWVQRQGGDAADTSQRSRGFLFASLGAAMAGQLGIARLILPDNGVISVNPPINAQIVGTLASRSTHPKFLWLFNQFIGMMFQTPVRAENPFGVRTRPEVLSILRTAGWEDLLQETASCSHPRGRTKEQPHCGSCSQCVDRRFGTIAANLEQHDLACMYERDIFTEALPEGEPLTVGESYVRFARWVRSQDAEQLFMELPELSDVIVPDCSNVPEVAESYAGMLKRHGAAVVRVLSQMIGRNQEALAAGTLPDTCLLRLATAGRTRPSVGLPEKIAHPLPPNLFRKEGRRRHIHFDGHETWVDDTVGTRQLARLFGEEGREVDVLDLVEKRPAGRGRPVAKEDRQALTSGVAEQEVLDDQAIAEFRARLQELSVDREAAERDGDQFEIARINRECEQIEEIMGTAKSLGGRSRSFTTEREKARQAVTRSIGLAKRAISGVHPALGRHLENSVSTGLY